MSGIVPPAAEEFQSTRPCGARQPRLVAQVDESTVSIHAPVRGATGHLGAATVGPPVSIHAPVRGATLAFVGQVAVVVVSIHAPVRGATAVVSACVASAAMFQSTRPCGARRFRPASSRPARQRFNPRARAGRDMMGRSRNSSVAVFQSTRPCGARHSGGETVQRLRGVSIHAPVRGATWAIGLDQQRFRVSIHAPVRGATRSLRRSRARTMFQSTRPCGARRERVVGVGRWLVVSIHAPVRGATLTFREPAVRACCFNPRARAGRDLRLTCAGELQHEFQSTRPCGARLVDPDVAVCAFQFQSTRPCGARRLYVRGDCVALRFQSTRPCGARPLRHEAGKAVDRVSIHAPVRGATTPALAYCCEIVFQSTRPCGARPYTDNASTWKLAVSIHAPVRGATASGAEDGRAREVSIHAPVRGATHAPVSNSLRQKRFNPRARAGRDPAHLRARNPPDQFQSTRPCGARLRFAARIARCEEFQSTRPCGARPPSYNLLISMKKTSYFSETCLL